jgi:hypothetical protein
MKSFIIPVVTGAAGIVIEGLSGRNTRKAFNIFFTREKTCYGKFAHNKEKFCTLKPE